ncbi:MAG: DUF624 domain-containing protein [Aristaeellaceae bacterium]
MQLFHPDSKFSQFVYAVTDYVKLGLVFLLFTLPFFTTGAAAAAVMTVGMRIERGEAPTIFRPFWEAFRANLRQGTALTLLFAVVFGLIVADGYVLSQVEVTSLTRLLTAALLLLALLGAGVMLWAFPTIARFRLTCRQAIHNAMIHMLLCFPSTLLALAAAVGGYVVAALVPQAMPVVILFVPAGIIWYMSRVCVRRFRRFDGSAEEKPREDEPETLPEPEPDPAGRYMN